MPSQLIFLKINLSILTKFKKKKKKHEFRSAILFIKKIEEHKPKKKSYKPRKIINEYHTNKNQSNIYVNQIIQNKINPHIYVNQIIQNKINPHIPTQTQLNHTNTKQN